VTAGKEAGQAWSAPYQADGYHDAGGPLPAEAEQLWEVNAGWWQEAFTAGADAEYVEQIIPLLAEQLRSVRPGRALDIGCGEGQLSRVAAGVEGTRHVVGVDPTRSQLSVALERTGAGTDEEPGTGGAAARGPEGSGPEGSGGHGMSGRGAGEAAGARVTYARASAASLPFADASFDAAFACLVFEHIEGTAGALAEVGRVLAPGGTFVLLLNHPLLQAPGSGWVDDQILGEQYWRIGPYLVEHHGVEEVDKDVWIPFVHRPLSVYVNAMAAAGLYLTRMEEPAPPEGFLARADEYREAAAFPRLLMLRAEKLARGR
jgi:ubiquinone/menaquinone biosynthesis C-methylase UbiE